MRRTRPLFLIAVWIFSVASFCFAKKPVSDIQIKAGVDKKTIEIGDLFTYRITVLCDKSIEIEFPAAGKNLGDCEVQNSGSKSNVWFGRKTSTQRFSLRSFSSGSITLPTQIIKYRRVGEKEWGEKEIPEQSVEIKSVLAKEGAQATLRDIQGPLAPASRHVFLIILFAILILVSAALVFSMLKKKDAAVVIPKRPAHEIALEQLEALRMKNLIMQGKVKEYFIEISDIIRHYLEERFAVRAPEMTTEEFLIFVNEYAQLISEHKALLKEFLSRCDMVKFAKYAPTPQESDAVFVAATQFVEQTKVQSV